MKTIIMKTKNIFKTGIFSIVILSLLISPILKSNISEVKAQNSQLDQGTAELQYQNTESSPEDQCAEVGTDAWYHTLSLAWWEHVNCVIQKSIIAALGTTFSAMVTLLIKWIMWAFSPATYGGFSTNVAVVSVWKDMRNLVNLFLALGLVFIAIATILGIKKYSWQQILWKLVVVALLVNFSLVMAGMILDVSHFFAYSFLNLAKGDSQVIGESLIKSFETEKLNENAIYSIPGIDTITPKGTKGWGLSWGGALIVIIVLLVIIVFTFISLLSVFAAMVIRSFIIVALLCLSPIAFASWIFPDTEKLWKMWWQQFIKWCTYPIIFALMLWIGISVVTKIEPGSSAELGVMSSIIRIFLFSMFLIGGLIFSVQGGGAVAQFVMKQGSKVALGLGSAGLGFGLGRVTSSNWYNNLARRLSAETGMLGDKGGVTGFLSRELSNQLFTLKGVTQAKQKEKEEKKLAKISGDSAALVNAARNAMSLGKTETVVRILAMKAKKNLPYTSDERHFMLRLPAQLQHTEDANNVYKYNSALRVDASGNRIPLDEIANRFTGTPINETNAEEIIESLENASLQQAFIDRTLAVSRNIREMVNFLRTIPSGHLAGFMTNLKTNILHKSLHNYLKDSGPAGAALVQLIEDIESGTSTTATMQDVSGSHFIASLWN